jgi:hypothetical protein
MGRLVDLERRCAFIEEKEGWKTLVVEKLISNINSPPTNWVVDFQLTTVQT